MSRLRHRAARPFDGNPVAILQQPVDAVLSTVASDKGSSGDEVGTLERDLLSDRGALRPAEQANGIGVHVLDERRDVQDDIVRHI